MTVGDGTLRQLAESCWAQAAADRPSFADVVACLAAAMRTYATSDFKVRNDALSARVRGVPPQPGQPLQTFEVLAGVQAMVFEYAHRHGIDLEVAAAFFDQEQRHALTASAVGHAAGAAVNEMLDQVQLIALRMYTSASKLPPGYPNGKELCSILQEAMVFDCTQHAVVLSRALTQYTVTGRSAGSVPVRQLPANVWRGGGLPRRHRHFFFQGQRYRAPCFLSTSATKQIAQGFMRQRGGPEFVLWKFRFGTGPDGQPRCDHFNFIDRHNGTLGVSVNQAAEDEWLCSPYAAFTVEKVEWRDNPTVDNPHIIELLAEIDNRDAPETLPNSPWG